MAIARRCDDGVFADEYETLRVGDLVCFKMATLRRQATAAPGIASVTVIRFQGRSSCAVSLQEREKAEFDVQLVPMKCIQPADQEWLLIEGEAYEKAATWKKMCGRCVGPVRHCMKPYQIGDDNGEQKVVLSVTLRDLREAARQLHPLQHYSAHGATFPYQSSDGRTVAMDACRKAPAEEDGNIRPLKRQKVSQGDCLFPSCHERTDAYNMRIHVAEHFEREHLHRRDVPDGDSCVPHDACGWCGQVGNGCRVHIQRNGAGSWVLDQGTCRCPLLCRFQLKRARKYCTNVVRCWLCPDAAHKRHGTTVWAWSMSDHIRRIHPSANDDDVSKAKVTLEDVEALKKRPR